MQAKEQLGFGAEEALLGVGLNLQSAKKNTERLNDESTHWLIILGPP